MRGAQAREFKVELDAQFERALSRVPEAARLLTALDTAPWSDALIEERANARSAALRCTHSGQDMDPAEVAAYLRRCGLDGHQ